MLPFAQLLRVADAGYEKDDLTLMPLYPLAVRTTADAMSWTAEATGLEVKRDTALKLAALYLNLVAFVVAGMEGLVRYPARMRTKSFLADILYSLSRLVLRDETLAYRAALLFCVGPASGRLSMPGADAIASMLSFAAAAVLERYGTGVVSAALLATLAGVRGGS